MNEECSVCKFWLSIFLDLECDEDEYTPEQIMEFKKVGMCRRYPPVAVTHEEDNGFYSFDGDATDFFEFVHTNNSDWCGEFVVKPNV